MPPSGELHWLLVEGLLSQLSSSHCWKPVADITIGIIVYFWSGRLHDRCDTCIYFGCLLPIGLVATFHCLLDCLLSKRTCCNNFFVFVNWSPCTNISCLCCLDLTIAFTGLRFRHNFRTSLFFQCYGWTYILSQLVFPTLRSDFYFIATCVVDVTVALLWINLSLRNLPTVASLRQSTAASLCVATVHCRAIATGLLLNNFDKKAQSLALTTLFARIY